MKERPRVPKSGKAYTTKRTADAEETVRNAWRASGNKKYPSDVFLKLTLYLTEEGSSVMIEPVERDGKPKLRGDIDNYQKLIMDALNEEAWDDDRQVVEVKVVKL